MSHVSSFKDNDSGDKQISCLSLNRLRIGVGAMGASFLLDICFLDQRTVHPELFFNQCRKGFRRAAHEVIAAFDLKVLNDVGILQREGHRLLKLFDNCGIRLGRRQQTDKLRHIKIFESQFCHRWDIG